MKQVKICGMMCEQDIAYVNEIGPDYCGFIINFPKSHRNLSKEQVRKLRKGLKENIKPVGVFVDEPLEQVAELLNEGSIEIAQLHGKEDNDYIERLKNLTCKPIWKAFQIKSREDVEAAGKSIADFVILDKGQGSGETFDWSYLDAMTRPFGLAGGLNMDNVKEALRTKAILLDTSGGVETNQRKDKEKIRAFVEAVKA